jgi:hypothetical protein
MTARRDVGAAMRSGDRDTVRNARRRVNDAKVELGERGPVWWSDGAPDPNQRMATKTPYAECFERLPDREHKAPTGDG